MKQSIVALILAVMVVARPAAAKVEPEERGSAAVAGVRVSAAADAWVGFPNHLGKIQPLLVSIENDSRVPLRIRYEDFTVVGPEGDRMAALPPFQIHGTVLVDPEFTPGPYPYPSSGFWVAPYLSRHYPRFGVFGGPFYYDPWYYSTYYPAFARVELPTADMIVKALPEGVIEPGGRMTGYIYIQHKPKHGKYSTFVFDLVDANGEQFGRVQFPIEVD